MEDSWTNFNFLKNNNTLVECGCIDDIPRIGFSQIYHLRVTARYLQQAVASKCRLQPNVEQYQKTRLINLVWGYFMYQIWMKYMRIEENIWFKKYVLIDIITVGK